MKAIFILHFDCLVVIGVVIVVVLVLTGYVSLCERRILALIQIRIGPGLVFFGLLTPLSDGIKLFLKFCVFVLGFDVVYFIGDHLLWFLLCLFDDSFFLLDFYYY